jgi:hypothetical protein
MPEALKTLISFNLIFLLFEVRIINSTWRGGELASGRSWI